MKEVILVSTRYVSLVCDGCRHIGRELRNDPPMSWDLGACNCIRPEGRAPADVRDALDVFIHETALPALVTIIAILFLLAVGAFIARGCHIVGLAAQNQLVHKAP